MKICASMGVYHHALLAAVVGRGDWSTSLTGRFVSHGRRSGIFWKAGSHSTRLEAVQINIILFLLKVKAKVKFTLEQGTKAQRVRCIPVH